MKKKFILVNNELGYPIYPDAKAGLKTEATDIRENAYEFVFGEDNPERKRKYWSAALGVAFKIEVIPSNGEKRWIVKNKC